MAKLPSIEFKHENQTGEVMRYKADVSITNDGTFSVTIPDELLATALVMVRKPGRAVEVTKPPTAHLWRVSGKQLDTIKDFIRDTMKDYLTCEVTTERIIAYGYKLELAFSYADNGTFHENGYAAQRESGIKSGNNGEGYHWEGELHANSAAPLFAVGLGARVFDKVTYTRPSGSTVKYERVPSKYSRTPLDRLNGFVGLSIKPEYAEQMPYSDEAAVFFYDAMIAMCRLAHQVKSFIGDKDRLALAIASRASMLPAPAATPALAVEGA
jgi:hypothetical protein